MPLTTPFLPLTASSSDFSSPSVLRARPHHRSPRGLQSPPSVSPLLSSTSTTSTTSPSTSTSSPDHRSPAAAAATTATTTAAATAAEAEALESITASNSPNPSGNSLTTSSSSSSSSSSSTTTTTTPPPPAATTTTIPAIATANTTTSTPSPAPPVITTTNPADTTTAINPSAATAPSSAPIASTSRSHSRRSTLVSRFPLLRKGSRDGSGSFSHFRGNSISNAPHSADFSFLTPRAPRAPSSSSLRGRTTDSQPTEPQAREPSTASTVRSESYDPADNISIRSTAALPAASSTGPSSSSEPADKLAKSQHSITSSGVAKPTDKKMHQTSSRLLRMTDDERPFTRDFKDLFSTLMVSLPLTPHRVRFRMIDFTFTSDEAVTNLGSLKFSQSNRMPDPKDSSRVVTTTTTTTFSMAKEMARSVCQKFLEAKFVESVEGKVDFQNKSSVWQLTPKGIHILDRFCSRNGIQSAHVKAVIDSNRNPHQLVTLERNTETDKLHSDEQTVEIIFRRFVGSTANETQSDSDSILEFSKCDVGVRLVKHRPTSSRQYEFTFNGRNAAEWLMDCSTMVDRREAVEIGSLFLQLKLIAPVDPRTSEHLFQPLKQTHYYITAHGERVAGWSLPDDPALAESNAAKARDGATRDSNSNRTYVIIRNPSWRLLFREFLKDHMCEENLSFYLEVQEFNNQYRAAVNASGDNKIETIRETLAAAYGLYNAFLAPGSPNELNIDHGLRTQLATRMTRAVGDDQAMMQSLVEVASLFDKAQNSIFKLMSSDSVPKFIKHSKYAPQLKGLDAAAAAAYATSPAGPRS